MSSTVVASQHDEAVYALLRPRLPDSASVSIPAGAPETVTEQANILLGRPFVKADVSDRPRRRSGRPINSTLWGDTVEQFVPSPPRFHQQLALHDRAGFQRSY